jgi:hypothetical protein
MNDTELAALRVLVAGHPGPYIPTRDPVYWLQVFTGDPVNTLTILTMAETLPALLARLAAAERVIAGARLLAARPGFYYWDGLTDLKLALAAYDAAREVRT